MIRKQWLRSFFGMLLPLTTLVAVAAPPAPPARPSFETLLARFKASAPDTNRLRLILEMYELAPPTFRMLPVLEEARELAIRLQRRDLALRMRSKMIHYVDQKQDFVAASRYAGLLLREAQVPPVDYASVAMAYNGLGNVAGAQRQFAEARKWFHLAVRNAYKAPPSERQLQVLAVTTSSLVQAYNYEVDLLQGKAPDSIRRGMESSIRKLIKVAERFRDMGNERQYQGFMGNVWDAKTIVALAAGDNDSTRIFKQRAIDTFTRLGAPDLVAMRRQHLANLELTMGNVPKAIALAKQSLAEGRQMQLLPVEADALQMLAQAYEKLRQPAEALLYYKRAAAIRDSVFSTERRAELTRLQVQFDTELKESQIRELQQKQKLQEARTEQQRQRLIALGIVLGLVVAGLSITIGLMLRLRRSQTKVAVMTATKDRLYALVAHDLRGPVQSLDSVPGIISMYLRRNDVEALHELPPLITDAVRRVNQLLDNLLHWAASQTGELSFNPEPLPAQLLLDECLALWQSTAATNQVTLEVVPAPAGATVRADPQMARTVLRNLVGNALKFTAAGGTVSLSAEADAKGTTLVVRDQGPGISAEDAAALLRIDAAPDGRLRRAGARGEKGTGLGLRLCALFMQRHGGTLTLDGQPGRGTTARAMFPQVLAVG